MDTVLLKEVEQRKYIEICLYKMNQHTRFESIVEHICILDSPIFTKIN